MASLLSYGRRMKIKQIREVLGHEETLGSCFRCFARIVNRWFCLCLYGSGPRSMWVPVGEDGALVLPTCGAVTTVTMTLEDEKDWEISL